LCTALSQVHVKCDHTIFLLFKNLDLCFVIDASLCFVLMESLYFRVDSFQTGVLYYVGQLKNHRRLGFTVLFVCRRYPALPYRKIIQYQIGTGLLDNYQMVLVLMKIFTGNCLSLLQYLGHTANQTVFHLDISFCWFRVMNNSNWCFCLYQL